MNFLAVINTITLIISLASIIILLLKRRNSSYEALSILIIIFLAVFSFYEIFLFAERINFPINLESIEDIAGAILPILWLNIFYMIVERCRVKKLAEREEQLNLVIEGGNLGFWDWDILTDEIVFNERWETMLGYNQSEIGQKTKDWKTLIHPEDLPEVSSNLITHLKNEAPFYKVEQRMLAKDKTWRWILVHGKVLERGSNNKALRAAGTLLDISPRKEIEIKLNESNKEYQAINSKLIDSLKEIRQINIELSESKEKAEENDRLKTTFLANLSHEIRTPMNSILGFTDLLQSPDISKDKQKKYLSIITNSGSRLLRLIDDLVDISKIEVGQIELISQPTNLNRLMDKIYNFAQHETNKKDLQLTVSKGLSDVSSIIITDEKKLEQILENLLSNAIKFTSSGEIDFGYKVENKQLHFWVKDSGKGILPKMKEVIFERFRQVDDTPLREEEGIGLGLSISKAFIELMQGEIEVESEFGVGSTFKFRLPYNKTIEELNKEEIELNQINNMSNFTILIAEDDDASFLYLSEILSQNKIETIHALNGAQAVKLFEENQHIKLVLMDLKMPIMNGFNATIEMQKINPNIPIIAQSAYVTEEDKQRAIDAGCVDFITKPIMQDEFMKVIRTVIGL